MNRKILKISSPHQYKDIEAIYHIYTSGLIKPCNYTTPTNLLSYSFL